MPPKKRGRKPKAQVITELETDADFEQQQQTTLASQVPAVTSNDHNNTNVMGTGVDYSEEIQQDEPGIEIPQEFSPYQTLLEYNWDIISKSPLNCQQFDPRPQRVYPQPPTSPRHHIGKKDALLNDNTVSLPLSDTPTTTTKRTRQSDHQATTQSTTTNNNSFASIPSKSNTKKQKQRQQQQNNEFDDSPLPGEIANKKTKLQQDIPTTPSNNMALLSPSNLLSDQSQRQQPQHKVKFRDITIDSNITISSRQIQHDSTAPHINKHPPHPNSLHINFFEQPPSLAPHAFDPPWNILSHFNTHQQQPQQNAATTTKHRHFIIQRPPPPSAKTSTTLLDNARKFIKWLKEYYIKERKPCSISFLSSKLGIQKRRAYDIMNGLLGSGEIERSSTSADGSTIYLKYRGAGNIQYYKYFNGVRLLAYTHYKTTMVNMPYYNESLDSFLRQMTILSKMLLVAKENEKKKSKTTAKDMTKKVKKEKNTKDNNMQDNTDIDSDDDDTNTNDNHDTDELICDRNLLSSLLVDNYNMLSLEPTRTYTKIEPRNNASHQEHNNNNNQQQENNGIFYLPSHAIPVLTSKQQQQNSNNNIASITLKPLDIDAISPKQQHETLSKNKTSKKQKKISKNKDIKDIKILNDNDLLSLMDGDIDDIPDEVFLQELEEYPSKPVKRSKHKIPSLQTIDKTIDKIQTKLNLTENNTIPTNANNIKMKKKNIKQDKDNIARVIRLHKEKIKTNKYNNILQHSQQYRKHQIYYKYALLNHLITQQAQPSYATMMQEAYYLTHRNLSSLLNNNVPDSDDEDATTTTNNQKQKKRSILPARAIVPIFKAAFNAPP